MSAHIKVQSLRITEIFYSLQGESTTVGLPTVFVRLTGCPLRCQYCDTAYAFQGGQRKALPDIMAEISKYQTKHVTITGGEPLAQLDCLLLMEKLCDRGHQVSIETSGALEIANIDPRVMIVMDLKTPASKESTKNLYQNIAYLKPNDQVKFVICDRQDYLWAIEKINQYQLTTCCQVLFSPSYQQLDPQTLADWILQDQLQVRFQLQLHKYIWGDVPGK